MLHSGSRGIGNMVGSYYMEVAQALMKKYFIELPDKDLAYLPEGTQEFDDYMNAVNWCQQYASENRDEMMRLTLNALERHTKEFAITRGIINCHHNFVDKENHFGKNLWITRKGAIRARDGDLGIIPGSMGQRSYIVQGLGNTESYTSCSHGAGRAMSRSKALKTFTIEDAVKQTQGVECRKDSSILDELPMAYKDIDVVMENQKDLVKPLFTLKQIVCVKG